MDVTTETPDQRPTNTKFCSLTDLSPIMRNDLYHLKARFNPITISGYDSTTDRDSNGCTFEENVAKCLKPPTYIRFVDPKNKAGNILPKNLPSFAFIEAIDLSDCGLTQIPPVLRHMKQLKVLNISGNHIHSLPDDWGHLDLIALDISHNVLSEANSSIKCPKNLEVLVMENCNLKDFPYHVLQLSKLRCLILDDNPMGKLDFNALQSNSLQSISLKSCLIPEFDGSLLTNVQQVNLRFNSIQNFPADLNRDITILKLRGNQLDTIPEEILLLQHLADLDISFCELKEFPQPVLRLKELQSLDISNNFIHNIPECVTKLSLKAFRLCGNPLDEFPTFLDKFEDLEIVDLSSSFLDAIPPMTHRLRKLRKLKVNDNCITEISEDICQLNLEKLNIADNPLNELPNSFPILVNLAALDISFTNMDEVPSQILSLSNLKRLSVKNNAIEKLPDDWRKCVNLRILDVSENPIYGLPASISQLQNLLELNVKSCCISEFPDVLLQLSTLQKLNIEENLLTTLPENFDRLNLKTLNLQHNLLSDLPESFSAQTLLKDLNLSSNRLTKFPPVIFKLHNLKRIFLNENFISVLPENLKSLHITTLSLKRNPLIKIGNSLSELKCIVSLVLNSCLLTEIPAYLSSFSTVTNLDLSDNNITSSSNFVLPSSLTDLSLADNPLAEVPQSIQNITKINKLSLHSCSLKELPTFIGALQHLEHLNISNNCLQQLPIEVSNTMLTTLTIYDNPLECLDSLQGLKRLRKLDACACKLRMFPKLGTSVDTLTELKLWWNSILSIPDDIQLSNLTTLALNWSNRAPPKAICNWTNLRTLYVRSMPYFPEVFLNLPYLFEFSVDAGDDHFLILPFSWKNLRNLQKIRCSYGLNLASMGSLSKLSNVEIVCTKEDIPPEAIKSKFLKNLDVSHHSVKSKYTLPEIPSKLLQSLEVRSHKLTAATLAEWKRLRELRVSITDIKGITEELSSCLKRLEVLDVGDSSTVTIPKLLCCHRLKCFNLTQAPFDVWSPILPRLLNLTDLKVSGSHLSTFPDILLELKQLNILNISNNDITDLPSEWSSTCLKHLNVADNSLNCASAYGAIVNLMVLETLNLSGNGLNKFPTSVLYLKYLRSLDMSDNPLSEFPMSMQAIQTLEIFKGSACKLHEFPMFLLKLRKIRSIELDGNMIKAIPSGWIMPSLKDLSLDNNKGLQISSHTLSGAGTLKRLALKSCALKEVPKLILRLPVLQSLDLRENGITRISEEVYEAMKQIGEVRLNTGNLVEPPREIYEGDEESIKQYYADLKVSQACKVGFHNVILLGSTTAGKTSLIRSLIKGESTLTDPDDRTVAVDEETWEIVDDLHFHIIDFGGHEVYELVYPIFLKDRKASIIIAVDLSVMSDQTIETNLFPWLYTVLSITGDSTDIIVVGTKADLCKDQETQLNYLRMSIEKWIGQMLMHANELLNSKELKEEKIAQIKHFKMMAVQEIRTMTTSSLSMSGLQNLKKILLNHGRDNVVHLPGSWHDLYKNLSKLKDQTNCEGFYRVTQLPRLCKQPMTTGAINACLTYMHQRGMVLWYGDHSGLADHVFYDIEFIIVILKQLLRHNMESTFERGLCRPFFQTMKEQQMAVETFRETGLASQKLLKCLWKDTADTDEIYSLAVCVLKLFSICYEADINFCAESTMKDQPVAHNKQRILLFPWFVRSAIDFSTLEEIWPHQIPPQHIPLKCNFVFEYSIPKSLFEQFSVQLQNLLAKCHHRKDWKGTIYIKEGAVQLLVRQTRDRINNTASITVEMRSKLENANQMYKLCVSVAKTIQVLRKTFPGILYNEVYVCPHCILTDADTEHTLLLDDALYEHPGETTQTDCKEDKIPAALHYPRLLGKSSDFIKLISPYFLKESNLYFLTENRYFLL